MKKSNIEALGIEGELADKVLKLYEEELKEWIPRKRLSEVTRERNDLKEQIAERDKQIEEIKISAGNCEELKMQIEILQADIKAKEQAHQAELKKIKIDLTNYLMVILFKGMARWLKN